MLTLSIQHLQNILDLMGLMLIQSIRSNYNVNPNTKYLNYIEHQIKCSNYSRIRFIPLNYNKLRINTSNKRHFELDPS